MREMKWIRSHGRNSGGGAAIYGRDGIKLGPHSRLERVDGFGDGHWGLAAGPFSNTNKIIRKGRPKFLSGGGKRWIRDWTGHLE